MKSFKALTAFSHFPGSLSGKSRCPSGLVIDNASLYSPLNNLLAAYTQVIVCVLEEESGLTLEVKDDGTGFDISEERAKQAFTTSGLRDDMKHFGLGMYISELYCKKHDGFLTVENQSGGACVRAYFRSIVPETEAF